MITRLPGGRFALTRRSFCFGSFSSLHGLRAMARTVVVVAAVLPESH